MALPPPKMAGAQGIGSGASLGAPLSFEGLLVTGVDVEEVGVEEVGVEGVDGSRAEGAMVPSRILMTNPHPCPWRTGPGSVL